MIGRRRFLAAAIGGLATASGALPAQSRSELPRVGLLFAAAPPVVASRVDALRKALASLGYAEGKQYRFEAKYANGDLTRMPSLAAELVRTPVDVIVTGGSSATRPARAATATIPIVMGQDNDPVAAGIVASLARPGGNVTGLTTQVPELSAKQLALLAEMVPGLQRVAVFEDSSEPGNAQSAAEARRAAERLGIDLQFHDIQKLGEPAQWFAAAAASRANGLLCLASARIFAAQDQVVTRAATARLPAIYAHPEFVHRGGLSTYGVSAVELFARAANYVVKILNGAKPGELPIEQPTTLEFVINLRTAKAIGLAIPQSVLLRADDLIQ